MLSVAEAQRIVLEHARPLRPATVPLDSSALGRVLAEDIASDLDMPPYDKALMDGYALRSTDLRDGRGELRVVEEITAGTTPRHPLGPGEASRIMTGAPIPDGADAVVMVERCTLDGQRVSVEDRKVAPGLNLLRRAREMRRGEVVLRAGTGLRPQELGLLATVGRTSAKVHAQPTVAVLPTGDEIVEPDQTPGPGQIRNSNGPMLAAQASRGGGRAELLGVARDTRESLGEFITRGLHYDVLILSGGVSAGKLDLVPDVLEELGIRALFHKVAMKPGKPVLFGVRPRDGDGPPRLVFGLPGNPVSSLVCFELFVRPAIRALMALEPGPRLVPAALAEDFAYRTDRPTYHPAKLHLGPAGCVVRPVAWFGSPDLRGIGAANAFVVLPEGEHVHKAGQTFPVLCPEEL